MSTKPVRGIKISKDGKIKKSVWYPNASAKIKARKSKKIKPVRRMV
jgi:hypothetical protein